MTLKLTRRRLFRRAADALVGAFAGSLLTRLPLAGATVELATDATRHAHAVYYSNGADMWMKSSSGGADWKYIGHIESPREWNKPCDGESLTLPIE